MGLQISAARGPAGCMSFQTTDLSGECPDSCYTIREGNVVEGSGVAQMVITGANPDISYSTTDDLILGNCTYENIEGTGDEAHSAGLPKEEQNTNGNENGDDHALYEAVDSIHGPISGGEQEPYMSTTCKEAYGATTFKECSPNTEQRTSGTEALHPNVEIGYLPPPPANIYENVVAATGHAVNPARQKKRRSTRSDRTTEQRMHSSMI